MADQKLKYLKAKAEEALSKENYVSAIDYYTQLHDSIVSNFPELKSEIKGVCERIVKLFNAVSMKYIQEGAYALLYIRRTISRILEHS